MSSPNIKRLVWTLSVVFLFSALASWPVRANDEDEFEFTGVISSLPNTAGFIGDWVVGRRTVHVTSSTRIEQEDGSPAVGKTVEVEGAHTMARGGESYCRMDGRRRLASPALFIGEDDEMRLGHA